MKYSHEWTNEFDNEMIEARSTLRGNRRRHDCALVAQHFRHLNKVLFKKIITA